MSNKIKYQMPVDDDEIEDGDEMVDMDDDYEEDQDQMEDENYDDDDNDENDGLADNQNDSNDSNISPQKMVQNVGNAYGRGQNDSDEEDDIEEEDQVATEMIQHQRHQPLQQQQLLQPAMGVNQRMRPQSAKTVPVNDQYRFHQYNPNQMMGQVPQTGNSHQTFQFGNQNYQNPAMNAMSQVYQQPNLYYPQTKGGSVKRRPGTASRRNQMQFGKKSAGGQPPLPPAQKHSSSQMDIEVSKLRPRVVQQERERLYDDVMKQRITTNNLKDDNTKLRTKIQMLETELLKKDRVIDDLILAQESMGGKYGMPRVSHKPDSHLVINLKRKIKDMQSEIQSKRDENEALKRNIRNTRMSESEIELKMYMEECARMRLQLEEVIRSKDTFADPQELKIIEEKFQQRDMLIGQLQIQNQEFSQSLQKKDEENRQLAELIQSMENKMKKAVSSNKVNSKYKKEAKSKDAELSTLRRELIAAKQKIQTLEQTNYDLQERNTQLQKAGQQQNRQSYAPPPQQNQSNPAQAAEIRRLTAQFETSTKKAQGQEKTIQNLQKDLQEKNDEMADLKRDLVRFKELSENYMKEVTRLEAQLEAADVKPKSKMSQRPKDNMTRDTNQASIQGNKIKSVDPKQLREVFQLLKLILQKNEVLYEELGKFFFTPFSASAEVSIAELKKQFESMQISTNKSLLLARLLIEPKSSEAVFDESLTENQEVITRNLQQHVGEYCLYDIDGSLAGAAVIKEREIQLAIIDRLKSFAGTVADALQCEDYDEEGAIDISQIKEALQSVDEEMDDSMMDYLLYYVFMRSESIDKMQYRHIIQLLESESKLRATSASRKSRPESSSPEKLKMRNPDLQAKAQDSDQYSDDPVNEVDGSDDESYLKDVQALKKQQQEASDGGYDDQEFDESPRPKKAQQQQDDYSPDDGQSDQQDEDVDEEEMIDAAEKIFIRIAEELIQRNLTVRAIFQEFLFEAEIDDEVYELLPPVGLLEGIKNIGIEDLQEIEVKYLLKVLSKPELDGAILMLELLQIFENFGLYDDEEGRSSQKGSSLPPTESPITKKLTQKLAQSSQKESNQSTPAPAEAAESGKKRKGKDLDLSKLNQKSVKHMVMLMLFLMEQNMTTQELFADVIRKQNVKTKTKQQTLDIMDAKDFFAVLKEVGIRKKDTSNANLQEFLQLSPSYPDLIVLKSVKRCLEQMAENEDFMNAIRNDVLQQADEDEMDQMDEQDYQEEMFQREQAMMEEQEQARQKLATVGENSENALTTHEKNSQKQKQQREQDDYEEDFEKAQEDPDDYEF